MASLTKDEFRMLVEVLEYRQSLQKELQRLSDHEIARQFDISIYDIERVEQHGMNKPLEMEH